MAARGEFLFLRDDEIKRGEKLMRRGVQPQRLSFFLYKSLLLSFNFIVEYHRLIRIIEDLNDDLTMSL
jgi:hypothetical protein